MEKIKQKIGMQVKEKKRMKNGIFGLTLSASHSSHWLVS